MTHVKWPLRLISVVGGLALIYPGLITDLIGAVALALIIVTQVLQKKKEAVA